MLGGREGEREREARVHQYAILFNERNLKFDVKSS